VSVTIDRVTVSGADRKEWPPDGQTYAYGYRRFRSDLYVVNGLL